MNTLRFSFIAILGITASSFACEDDSGDPTPTPGTDATGAPVIESVNGDGSASTEPGAAPNRIASSLDVRGQNLSGAEVTLASIGSSTVFQSLAVAAGSTANQLLVSLPSALTPGNYTLTVSTAMGQTSADVTLLQGEPGVCDTSECAAASGGLPGASATTVLRLQSSTAAGLEKSIIANGVELIESEEERQNDGIFALALDRTSHAIARGAVSPRNFGPAEEEQFATFLSGIDESVFVVLASRGNVSSLLTAEVQISGADTTIGAFLTESLGGPSNVSSVGAGDSVILVGHTETGMATASYAFSSGGIVQTAVLLVDDQITGANTAPEAPAVAIPADTVGFSQLKCYVNDISSADDLSITVRCSDPGDVPIAGGCAYGSASLAGENAAITRSYPVMGTGDVLGGWRCTFSGPPGGVDMHRAAVTCCQI
ncbi:MAG: hypothetical protein AAFV36_06110 [Myxococcota bacterium]